MVISWPDAMEDINYKEKNFKLDLVSLYHPLWMTEGHYIYHLLKDDSGQLSCQTDQNGEPICSPRFLTQLSIMKLVCDPSRMRKMSCGDIPGDVFPGLLTEALLQKELISIEYLVSNWPHPVLDLQSLMPLEDHLRPGYLTQVLGEGNGNMSLLDCIMMGLLNLKGTSPLKEVNLLGFKNDKKLCRELARLPILWMEPKRRKVQYVHGIVSKIIDISPDRVRRFLNRITSIYSNMDPYIKHGNKIGPIKIKTNCKVTLDDVPIGLALQQVSPFRFDCTRVWMESIAEIYLPLRNIPLLINSKCITHLEVEEQNLCQDVFKLTDFLEGLLMLTNLDVLSLPNTIHVNIYPEAPYMLNQVLRSLTRLSKLHLPSCNLRDSLGTTLAGLAMTTTSTTTTTSSLLQQQPPPPSFECLNLRDCRLSECDLVYLVHWEGLAELRELNLSRNNLKAVASACVALLDRMPDITCFSISYCCLAAPTIARVADKCGECRHLKAFASRTFTPLAPADARDVLERCAAMRQLQMCTIVPDTYAFPGADDAQRTGNRIDFIASCRLHLRRLGRADVEVD